MARREPKGAQRSDDYIMSTTAADGRIVRRIPGVGVFARLVGPAALTAAGMIGAGAVATRLPAGAWFGFDFPWVALYVIPMVIFTLDSASRVAVFSLVLVIYGVVGLLR